MHPKRHPVIMDMEVGCDARGKLTALKLKAIGDTGAYASVGMKVMERVAGHAAGGYFIPEIDIEALTVYTNNIPSPLLVKKDILFYEKSEKWDLNPIIEGKS